MSKVKLYFYRGCVMWEASYDSFILNMLRWARVLIITVIGRMKCREPGRLNIIKKIDVSSWREDHQANWKENALWTADTGKRLHLRGAQFTEVLLFWPVSCSTGTDRVETRIQTGAVVTDDACLKMLLSWSNSRDDTLMIHRGHLNSWFSP